MSKFKFIMMYYHLYESKIDIKIFFYEKHMYYYVNENFCE